MSKVRMVSTTLAMIGTALFASDCVIDILAEE